MISAYQNMFLFICFDTHSRHFAFNTRKPILTYKCQINIKRLDMLVNKPFLCRLIFVHVQYRSLNTPNKKTTCERRI